VNDALPVLESVTVSGTLAVLSATFPKARAAGDTPANGAPVLAAKDAVLDHAEVMFGPGVQ
jgi:hypothetical protein